MSHHQTFHVPVHPGSSSAAVSHRMSTAKRRDTAAEVLLRRELHAQGLRYRVNAKVPDRPRRTIDVAFTRVKVAVFIDGCFWHGCPEHGTAPRSNASWWQMKLRTNRDRDADTTEHLQSLGWLVLRFWEHESPRDAAATVVRAVGARHAG